MNDLNQLFSTYNDGFSGRIELEFELHPDGLVIEKLKNGKTYTHPFIIPGVDETDVRMWFYEHQQPVHITGTESKNIEWYDIPLDNEVLRAFYYGNISRIKKLNEDGTY